MKPTYKSSTSPVKVEAKAPVLGGMPAAKTKEQRAAANLPSKIGNTAGKVR